MVKFCIDILYFPAESEHLKSNYDVAENTIAEYSRQLEILDEELQQLKNDYNTIQDQNQLLKEKEEESTRTLSNLREEIIRNNEKVC